MAPAGVLCENRAGRAMQHDVFISYASRDRAAAEAVCTALEERGIRCWIAPRNVLPGEDWGEAILAAIGRAHAMVVVMSRQTAASVHVRNEVVTATANGLALVPVRIEDAPPGGALRLHLAGWHWLDAFPPPVSAHAEALAAGVRGAIAADVTLQIPAGRVAPAAVAEPLPRGAPELAFRRADTAAMPMPAPVVPRPAPAAREAPAARPAPAAAPRRGLWGLVAACVVILGLAAGAGWAWWSGRLAAWLPELGGGTVAPAPAPVIAPAPPAPSPTPDPGAPVVTPRPEAPPVLPPVLPVPTPAPPAAPAGLRLTNIAAETISRLYVYVVTTTAFGEDWLGQAQITPGNSVLLRAPAGGDCLFNIRIVYVGGRTEDRSGVDLCNGPELRFDGSKARQP